MLRRGVRIAISSQRKRCVLLPSQTWQGMENMFQVDSMCIIEKGAEQVQIQTQKHDVISVQNQPLAYRADSCKNPHDVGMYTRKEDLSESRELASNTEGLKYRMDAFFYMKECPKGNQISTIRDSVIFGAASHLNAS